MEYNVYAVCRRIEVQHIYTRRLRICEKIYTGRLKIGVQCIHIYRVFKKYQTSPSILHIRIYWPKEKMTDTKVVGFRQGDLTVILNFTLTLTFKVIWRSTSEFRIPLTPQMEKAENCTSGWLVRLTLTLTLRLRSYWNDMTHTLEKNAKISKFKMAGGIVQTEVVKRVGEYRFQNLKFKVQNPKHEIQHPKLKTLISKSKIPSSKF